MTREDPKTRGFPASHPVSQNTSTATNHSTSVYATTSPSQAGNAISIFVVCCSPLTGFCQLLLPEVRHTVSNLSQAIRFLVDNEFLENVELKPGDADNPLIKEVEEEVEAGAGSAKNTTSPSGSVL